MEKNVYQDLSQLQEHHWWFKARREILGYLLSQLKLPKHSQILEVGCGTGGNLLMLGMLGEVYGMEMNEYAAAKAIELTGKPVLEGSLPNNIPYKQKFDLICLLDVLEHIEDDDSAISALKPLLKPGGRIVLTVPAYQWMYGKHDTLLHHFRRYTQSNLAAKIFKQNMTIEKSSYFNTLLFPLAVIARMLDSTNGKKVSTGYNTPSNFVNYILFTIFRLEKCILKFTKIPFGCSLFLVCKLCQ